MKIIRKKTWIVLLLLAAVVLLFLPFRERVVIRTLEARLEKALGTGVRIESMEGSVFKGRFVVRGLRLLNEDQSVVPELMVIPVMAIDLDLRTLLSRDVHLRKFHMEVARIIVVRDELGKTNIDAAYGRMNELRGEAWITKVPDEVPEPGLPAADQRPAVPVPLQVGDGRRYTIGELDITIGQVELHGTTADGQPLTPRIYPLPENSFRYENVEDIVPVGQDIMMVLALFVGPQLKQDLEMLQRVSEIQQIEHD